MIHSTYRPIAFSNSLAQVIPSAGSFGLQEYSAFGPWCQMSFRLGTFQLNVSTIDLLFTMPAGITARFLKPSNEQLDLCTAFIPGAPSQIVCSYDLAPISGQAPLPDGLYFEVNRVGQAPWPMATDITIYANPLFTLR